MISMDVNNLRGVISYMNECRMKHKYIDLVIKVENRSFPCHRTVLASTMTLIRSILDGNLEAAAGNHNEIRLNDAIDDITAEEFQLLLDFVYGNAVPVSRNKIFRLLVLADHIGLETLEDSCIKYTVEKHWLFSSETVITALKYAHAAQNTPLVDVMIKSMARCFVSLIRSQNLYGISGIDLLEIVTRAKEEGMTSDQTTIILNFLREWIKFHSVEETESLLPVMLGALNVGTDVTEWIANTLMEGGGNCHIDDAPRTAQNELEKDSFSQQHDLLLDLLASIQT